jgi:hypothetical protein
LYQDLKSERKKRMSDLLGLSFAGFGGIGAGGIDVGI